MGIEKTDRNISIRVLVLNGSRFSEVSKLFGISSHSVRTVFLRECRKLNPEKFDDGILRGSTNNYLTPPISYLRENKKYFLRN